MNKNKTFKWMLMAALTVGLSMNFAACSSDDDDENENGKPDPIEETTSEEEIEGTCFNILSILSQVGDDLPSNWKTATFDVLEGKVTDESNPFVRTVVAENLAGAVEYYNSLTGQNISTSTKSDKWSMEGIGSMEFTAVNQSDCFATIDVNVKQLPRLQQLRLAPASAIGLNAAFDGEPYYRLGDVILDKENTYWVCVRQCYSPDENDISHWISFQIISGNPTNLHSLNKSGMQTQMVVDKLGNQRPAMWYGAQLMAALSRTSEYISKHPNGILSNDNGLGGLKPGAMPNNELQQVSQYWDQLGIWDKIKPSGMSVSAFKDMFNKTLTFAYNKYRVVGNMVEQPYVRYSDPANFYVADPAYAYASSNMVSTSIDMATYVNNGTGNFSALGNSALVVRHKNGFNFTGAVAKALSPTVPINSVTTVYRFAEQ